MSIIMIHYDKTSKIVRLLDKKSMQTKDVSESALIEAMRHKKISVENLKLEGEQLKGTNGSLDRYESDALTVIRVIKSEDETFGFEISDCKGSVKKLKYDDCLIVAKQYGLTNARLAVISRKEFISSINGEHEPLYIRGSKKSKDEPSLLEKVNKIKEKAAVIGSESNLIIYNAIINSDKQAIDILKYTYGDNIQFINYESALAHPQYSAYVTNMSELFKNYTGKSLDLSLFDTSNVTDMKLMFENCEVESLELLSFDTSKVKSMEGMFAYCKTKSLDLSSFDVSNVVAMGYMFNKCEAQSINMPSFNTHRVIDMTNMFGGCKAELLDLSSFNTSSVNTMYLMFYECEAQSLDLSSFDTSHVTDMGSMFEKCKAKSIDMSSFDTSKVTLMRAMFKGCRAELIKISSFNTSNVTDMSSMFYGCMTHELNLASFDMSKVNLMEHMFKYCKAKSIECSSETKDQILKDNCKAKVKVV